MWKVELICHQYVFHEGFIRRNDFGVLTPIDQPIKLRLYVWCMFDSVCVRLASPSQRDALYNLQKKLYGQFSWVCLEMKEEISI